MRSAGGSPSATRLSWPTRRPQRSFRPPGGAACAPGARRTFVGSSPHTREHELGPVWLFAASTGVRRSELLGVRWSDIDLRAVIVTIRQTVLNSEDGHRPEEDQKTVASARTIHLDRRTVAMLRAHRAVQAKTRLAAGAGWEDNDLHTVERRLVEPGQYLQRLPPRGQGRRGARDTASRRPPHTRLAAAEGRGQPEGRVGAARAQLGGVHSRHLRPRHARYAARGRRDVHAPWCSARSTRTRPCAQPRRTSDGRS